jgi:uncharacterized protein
VKRLYSEILQDHFEDNKQMAFLMGPRQVGKTHLAKLLQKNKKHYYFNWDNDDHRKILLQGPTVVAEKTKLNIAKKQKTIIIFDEIQKYSHWKNYVKGFFDTYGSKAQIIVTGSSKLDVFQKGGDSMMGRYFTYRICPLTIGEILNKDICQKEHRKQQKISDLQFQKLWDLGGFPEPFIKGKKTFYNKWKKLRYNQLVKEDIRDLTPVQYINKVEILLEMIRLNTAQLVSYNTLSKKVGVSDISIKKWINYLINLYFCFQIRPWSRNKMKLLIKEPKYFLWDWALCEDEGKKAENFVAVHLLKAVNYWNDMGIGDYELYFLRDLKKKEVDFLLTKNNKPWIMIEVKKADESLSSSLIYFYNHLKPEHAFQVVIDMDYKNINCFDYTSPTVVPAKTFLSQLF